MKIRHVRAVAVVVGVVVALTGAKRSSGGGCDDSSSSSSSSSSSGGTHYDDDGDDYSSSGGVSGGGSATATAEATRDVRIRSCVYDATRGVVATVEATNTSTVTTYTYEFGVTFKNSSGAPLRTSSSTIPYVSADTTETLDVAASYVPDADESMAGVTCELGEVTRTAE